MSRSRFTAMHRLRERTGGQYLAMACGLAGTEAGWPGEFETNDGREARLNYTQADDETTCKRCLAAMAQAADRAKPSPGR